MSTIYAVDNKDWGSDDTDCNILHVDMDCFFSACEEIMHPQIKGKPVVVAGLGSRGVVCAANYEARAYGVRSAMSFHKAQQLCPNAIFLQVRLPVYRVFSKQIMDIFARYTDTIEPLSLDEAFLDVSGSAIIHGSAMEIATKIRSDIFNELGLNASIGVAENMFLAKLASAQAKPNGMLLVARSHSKDFLYSLPLEAIWGLGTKGTQLLKNRGIDSIEQASKTSVKTLQSILGNAMGQKVFDLSHGIDSRKVGESSVDKSVSTENTFNSDIFDLQDLRLELLKLTESCCFSLRKKEFLAKTITLKLKFSDRSVVTRSKTIDSFTNKTKVVYDVILQLLEQVKITQGVRLAGVKTSNILTEDMGVPQLLFSDDGVDDIDGVDRYSQMLKAEDEIKDKYGKDMIMPAALMKRK